MMKLVFGKFVISFLVLLIPLRTVAAGESGTGQAETAISTWEKKLRDSRSLENPEKLEMLWQGLRTMHHYSQPDDSDPRSEKIYRQIQQEILFIGDHADYYASKVEEARKAEGETPIGNRTTYNYVRQLYLGEVLPFLPSPQTVAVLGHYLDDERDASPNIELPPENAWWATSSLSEMGIVAPPEPSPVGYHRWKEGRANWKTWWDAVKSGQRSFAFKGQPVSYRFKPDGSVETAPRDASKDPVDPPPARTPSTEPEKTLSKEQPAPSGNRSTPWFIGGSLVILMTLLGFLMKKRNTAES